MRVTISYEMLTGKFERRYTSTAEAVAALDALEGTGAANVALSFDKLSMAAGRLVGRKIDASSQSISLADARRPDCPLIFVNKGFEQLTGYTRDECRGRNCRFLQGPETSEAAVAEIRTASQNAQPLIVDILNYRKDGSTFWNRLSLKPVRNARGELTHIIGIQSDITRMLSLEADLEAWAMDLGRFPHLISS